MLDRAADRIGRAQRVYCPSSTISSDKRLAQILFVLVGFGKTTRPVCL